ncbi:GNAT family N-acetyltransferase [Rhizobium sp. C4]|uniref:GNAT family N-acetyltransferase n=1 Tax=Rhizobium sp. C4 TaxID=1349800 RepID=UPI003FA68F37
MSDIRVLDKAATLAALTDLIELFSETVRGGASMGYMLPFPADEAEAYWRGVAEAAERGDIVLMALEDAGRIVGSVQLGIAMPPNQPHRADIKKLMVHPDQRGRGLSRRLMEAAEREAAARGRSLLVLDTATGEPAEKIYEHLGWTAAGIIPGYALFPDGRPCDTTVYYKALQTLI